MKTDFLPIILGSDENAYGTARLFAEAYGVKPLLLCMRQLKASVHSSLFRIEQIPEFNRPEIFVSALLAVLRREAESAEKLLVIPCVDYYTELLSEYADRFEGMIANSFVPKELLDEVTGKHRFCELCRKYDLPHPKTLIIPPEKRRETEDCLPDSFPIVLKPENSNSSAYLACSFPGKKKVYYIHSRQEYRQIADALDAVGYPGTLVAQEYVPGGEDALWIVNTYSDADGKVRAMGMGQVILAEHDPLMRGNHAAIISRYDASILESLREFLESIGYVGFANFDLKIDPRTQTAYVFECNPRLGRSSFYLRAAGMNILKIFTEDVVYGHREDCMFADTTALWRNVPMAVLKRYGQNRTLVQEAETLAGKGLCMSTRGCHEDRNLLRSLEMLRYDLALARSYRRYPSAGD